MMAEDMYRFISPKTWSVIDWASLLLPAPSEGILSRRKKLPRKPHRRLKLLPRR
jgi:hypothetical protein